MIVVTNRIPVAPGWEEKFEERFKQRAHLVDQSPGFIRNQVLRPTPMKIDHGTGEWSPAPEKDAYYEVKTWWRSFDDFVAWTLRTSTGAGAGAVLRKRVTHRKKEVGAVEDLFDKV